MDEAREWLEQYERLGEVPHGAPEIIRSLLAELEKLSTVQLPNGKISNTFEAYLAWKSKAEQAEAEREALKIKSKHVVSMINTIRQVMVKSLEHKGVFGGAVYLVDHTHMWALVRNAEDLDALLPASLRERIEQNDN